MEKQFIFQDFVLEYGVTFTVRDPNDGGYFADNGKWIEGSNEPIQVTGIVLPLSDDDLQFSENGTFTQNDRKLYTIQPLTEGWIMEYKGKTYTIQGSRDYSDYADVYTYYARGAN